MSDTVMIEQAEPDRADADRSPALSWYALWTRSHCEHLVRDQLAGKGFDVFLPQVDKWSKRGSLRHVIRVPMFAGYLFLRVTMDKASYIAIKTARGLVGVLGDRWDRLAPLGDPEVDAVRRVVESRAPALPYPYLREGQRVRITCGPLADVEGILVRTKPTKGLLVISVELLRRSVAVQVDCTSVAPV